MQQNEPQYQAVARAALKYLDRAWAQGTGEAREMLTVHQFLREIAEGQQEVKEITEEEDDG